MQVLIRIIILDFRSIKTQLGVNVVPDPVHLCHDLFVSCCVFRVCSQPQKTLQMLKWNGGVAAVVVVLNRGIQPSSSCFWSSAEVESNSSVPVSSQRPLGRPLWLDLLQTDGCCLFLTAENHPERHA